MQFVDTSTNATIATAALSNGFAAATVAASAGAHPTAAIYSGDANFSPSTSAPVTLLSVSDAAGYGSASVAPDEILSIFGGAQSIAGSAAATVQVIDSSGDVRVAPVFLASLAQLNISISGETALGPATVTVTNPSGSTFSRKISVTRTAPGLFAANGTGKGPAAAEIIRMHADGSQSTESVAVFDAARKEWVAAPVSWGSDTLYLVLYGTGIRHRSDNADVTCAIKGQTVPVLYSGSQGSFPGLDQINVQLPPGLKSAGEVNVTVAVDGRVSNAVTLSFQ